MTIQAITGICPHPQAPAAYANCYCYDSIEHDLIAEPIVHDATEVIKLALAHAGICKAGDPPTEVLLQFTDDLSDAAEFNDQSVAIKLTFNKQEDGFTFYKATILKPERAAINAELAGIMTDALPLVPLCKHLYDYYVSAPKILYISITAIK